MARPPGSWRRGKSGPWYTTLDGRQHKLAESGESRATAREQLDRLLARDGRGAAGKDSVLTARDVFNLFLAAVEGAVGRGERAGHTFDGYRRHLESAVEAFGGTRAAQLKPLHVSRWIDATDWGPTTRNGAISAVKAALNWARREGYLEHNPLAEMARPAARRREAVLTEEQADRLMTAIPDQEFRDLIVALRETGARPGEVAGVTAAVVDLEAGTWSVANKTRAKTGEPRRRSRPTHPSPGISPRTNSRRSSPGSSSGHARSWLSSPRSPYGPAVGSRR